MCRSIRVQTAECKYSPLEDVSLRRRLFREQTIADSRVEHFEERLDDVMDFIFETGAARELSSLSS